MNFRVHSTPPNPGASPAAAPVPRPRSQRILAYRWFWLLAVCGYGLDRLTKSWIVDHLAYGSYGPKHSITIVRGFFHIVHLGNTGAAWSLFSGMGTALGLLALATLLAIFIWRRALGLQLLIPQLCFGALCGGTAGNLTDRLRYGHVIDFLDFHFGNYVYPTFNVADICIVGGVIGYILWSLRHPDPGGGK